MSGVVHAQANGNMDDYFPQTVLAKKIEVRKAHAFSALVLRGRVGRIPAPGLASLSEGDSPFLLALPDINP